LDLLESDLRPLIRDPDRPFRLAPAELPKQSGRVTPVSTRTLVSALVEIGRKQLTGVSDVVADGGRVRIIWAQGIPVSADESGTSSAQSRDPRERNRNAVLACLRWEPAGSSFSFRESQDVLRGVPQNPVSMGPLIVLSARRGFDPRAAATLLSAREALCPLLALAASALAQQLELRPNEVKLLELLDGTAPLRNVLTRCELDELHSLQLLAVLEVLELVRWGPPRPSARPEVVQTVVVPRTPMSRPNMPAMRSAPTVPPEPRMTPVSPRAPDPRMTPSSPVNPRLTPSSPFNPRMTPMSDPRMTPTSPRVIPTDPRMTPMEPPRFNVTPPTPAAPTMPPARPSTMTPVRRPSVPAASAVPGSAAPGSSPYSARLTPRSVPASGRSTPPLSSAEARVEAADLYQQGRSSLKAGQTKQAQEQFARAAMLAPEMFEYLLQEALLEYLSATAQEDRERLTKRLEGLVVRALTKDRKLAIAHRVRGYLALTTGQDDAALKAFKLAKDLDPEDIDAQRHYLVLMRRKKR
jgi:hypothetical protein